MTAEGPRGLIYGLEFQCRALCSIDGDNENVGFLVGTQSLKATNQIHQVIVEEENKLLHKTIFSHPQGEVWDLCSSPVDPDLFISRYSNLDESPGGSCQIKASLWSKESSKSEVNTTKTVQSVCKLGKEELSGDISHVSFMPGNESKVMILNENRLFFQDVSKVENNFASVISTGALQGKGHTSLSTGAWNPHQNCQSFAAVNDHLVKSWDVRSMQTGWSLETQGHQVIRSLDFNPNKQYYILTGSDDGCLRFWDIRKPEKPLVTRADHSHWIWCAKFNQFHDQLVLSGSSDCHVQLTCLASISSEPYGHIIDDDQEVPNDRKTVLSDGLVKTYDDHEESVYILAWSSTDPWTFASLSYDGRLVINTVPRDAKFKILNLD